MNVTLSELLNMLQSTQDLIKKDKPTVMVTEKSNASMKLKPKFKNFKKNNKGYQAAKNVQGEQGNKEVTRTKAKEIVTITVSPVTRRETAEFT